MMSDWNQTHSVPRGACDVEDTVSGAEMRALRERLLVLAETLNAAGARAAEAGLKLTRAADAGDEAAGRDLDQLNALCAQLNPHAAQIVDAMVTCVCKGSAAYGEILAAVRDVESAGADVLREAAPDLDAIISRTEALD